MAECVVDVLEMIEVDIQNCKIFGIPARPGDYLLQRVDKDAPVRQPGQKIVVGHPRDLLFRPFALRYVTEDRQNKKPFADGCVAQ